MSTNKDKVSNRTAIPTGQTKTTAPIMENGTKKNKVDKHGRLNTFIIEIERLKNEPNKV